MFRGQRAELEHHRQAGHTAAVALGPPVTQSHRRERALDRVGRPQMPPVLGREVVERQQHVAVFGQTCHGLRELRLVVRRKVIERRVRILSRRRHPDLVQLGLGPGLHPLGHFVQYVDRIVDPASLLAGL